MESLFKNTINIFIEVVEQGSFSAAAKKLFMTQSAVSQQINHLEKELGYQLFNRKEYRPKLTEAGELYYQLCKNMIQEYIKREKQIREIAKNTSSKIQLAITGNFEQQYFPDMIKSFISNNHVKVDTRQSTFQEGVEWLLDGKVDLAFGLMNEFIRYPELEAYQVLASHICFVCSADHPLSCYDTVSIKELVDEPIVVLSSKMGKYYYDDFMEAFRKDGFLPNIVKEVENMGDFILPIRLGEVSGFSAREVLESYSGIAMINLKDTSHQALYGIAHRKDTSNRFVPLFAEELVKYFQEYK